ncbi:helix-turn-helix domain-containing protein [Clostridium novyi]|uniref:helix-turn-helix domain-containing protein n=1 Tax=Clostridium novyi TaxID=1542 RepID=UPI0023B826B2|nr:helix-turn-helix transcriptional regulator [Clostridium novyi]
MRKTRLEKSISINEFSKRYNMTRAHISAIELGKHDPSPSTLKKLGDALEKPFWWLGGYDKLPQKTLGEKITKCRLMHGYTQKEFANVLSVQESTLIDWEKDKNKPNVSNLKKLETFLEILIKK